MSQTNNGLMPIIKLDTTSSLIPMSMLSDVFRIYKLDITIATIALLNFDKFMFTP